MGGSNIAVLLDRYLKGETTPAENELIERWIEENGTPGSGWEALDQFDKDQWLSAVFKDIKVSINEEDTKIIPLPARRRFLWKGIAAAAAVLIISFTLYLEWPALQSHAHRAELTAFSVPLKQKKQLTLPDGSQVWVNAGSTLRYPKAFSGKTRAVYLSGEAFFDIKHNSDQPFIIYAGKLVTTVLGTAFDIKEDKDNHTVEVTVTRGKVSVANGTKLLGVLTPNQQISLNTFKNAVTKKTVDANLFVAWQQSELHFDDISFEDAALRLQTQFNVKISFANQKLKACRFTGTALQGAKLDKILNVICAFNQATYQTKSDGSIVIDGPGCAIN
jgi:ferric-dicitrate binding protein FerR (iron transport regulator)